MLGIRVFIRCRVYRQRLVITLDFGGTLGGHYHRNSYHTRRHKSSVKSPINRTAVATNMLKYKKKNSEQEPSKICDVDKSNNTLLTTNKTML